MRIAHVTTVHSLNDNRIRFKECAALARAGHEVFLVGPGKTGDDLQSAVDGFEIRRVGQTQTSRISRVFVGSKDVFSALRDVKPDVVHAHDPELIPLLLAVKFTLGSKVVYDAHEVLVGQVENKAYIPAPLRSFVKFAVPTFLSATTRFLDGVISATPTIAEEFTHPTHAVVKNYPWLDAYSNQRGNDRNLVGYVGGVTMIRGLKEMTEAVRASQHADRLVLAGPAHDECLEYIDQNTDVIEYLGQVKPTEVPELLSKFAVGLVLLQPVPSHLESLPTKLFEYMASSIPFIASDFGFWKDNFGHLNAGRFVDSTSAQVVADVIDELLSNSELSDQLGTNGREAVTSGFCFENEAKELIRFYETLAE